MTRHISEEEAQKWENLSKLWKDANEALEVIELELILNFDDNPGRERALQEVNQALDATRGNSYMFTPQSEWMGGDSSDSKNFKIRPPHICSSPRIIPKENANESLEK